MFSELFSVRHVPIRAVADALVEASMEFREWANPF